MTATSGSVDGRARNEAIDAFRGVSIILVVVFHYLVRWAPPFSPIDYYHYSTIYDPILTLGRHGVELFFVISGLVITMTAERVRGPIDFGVKRFARLFPALVVAAVVTWFVLRSGPPAFTRTLMDLAASLTFFPQVFGREYIDGAYWSLTVEVRFYVVIALGLFIFKQRFWIAALAVALPSAALTFLGSNALLFGYWGYFLVGMAGWYWIFENRRRLGVVLGGTGLLAWAAEPLTLGARVFIATLVALLLFAIHRGWRPILLPALGRISYSLYLLHQRMGVILIAALVSAGWPDLAAASAVVLLMTLAAALMQRYVEAPSKAAVLTSWKAAQRLAERFSAVTVQSKQR